MVELTRRVRFAVNPPSPPSPSSPPSPPHASPINTGSNGYAGIPAIVGLGRHYELILICRGEPDPVTGYFLDIKVLDHAARTTVIPAITRACHATPFLQPHEVLLPILAATNTALSGTLVAVCWMLSPTYGVEMSPATPHTCAIRQRFEIAAAHRLHVPTLSDDENRRLFGKCNNPSGHGHNYIIEPCVEVDVTAKNPFTLADLERLTHETIIARFDHTNLSTDHAAFRPPTGLHPSVENISRVFYELLAPVIADAWGGAGGVGGARLRSVTVFETEKTSSTYPA